MPFDPQKHHRRSIRLRGYDYTLPGAYFVTLVTWQRKNLFGEILDGKVRLNAIGKIVEYYWLRLPQHFPVCLDAWVVMPNHFHGIILLESRTGEASATLNKNESDNSMADASPQHPIGTHPGSLGAIIQNFKSVTTRKIHARIWQRNYFERIIRNDAGWNLIREYISVNPLRWREDRLYR